MRRTLFALFLAVIVGVALYGVTARATPGSGFTAATLAVGTFGELDLKSFGLPADPDVWQARLKTFGGSDVYVQSNTWEARNLATETNGIPPNTGWHTHPGFSLIFVTQGTLTAYESDDPTCTPHVYTAGQTLLDPGGDHAHLIRNEYLIPGQTVGVEARTIAVQFVPQGTPRSGRRVDAPNPNPGSCPQ